VDTGFLQRLRPSSGRGPLAALRRGFRERRHRWIRRRQGSDRGTITLTGRRLYILPTRTGLIFAAVLFTMLLGALNYSNNMGFALVFLLVSVAIVSIHHCQQNLAGLTVSVTASGPVFAGEPLRCTVRLANPGNRHRWQVVAGADTEGVESVDVAPGGTAELHLSLPTTRRGRVECPEIRLATLHPLGLFRAWTWLYPDLDLLVYPQPAERTAMPVHTAAGPGSEGGGGGGRGSDDFAGLRTYVPGEPLSRIAWKSLARTGELLAKDYRGGNPVILLDWYGLADADTERRLSLLTRMLLDAQTRGQSFGLRLPGMELAPAAGPEHGQRCLEALALFGVPEEVSRG
jgi:uncharacterized protein (DUF58 family)